MHGDEDLDKFEYCVDSECDDDYYHGPEMHMEDYGEEDFDEPPTAQSKPTRSLRSSRSRQHHESEP